jgi:hypothetical protein
MKQTGVVQAMVLDEVITNVGRNIVRTLRAFCDIVSEDREVVLNMSTMLKTIRDSPSAALSIDFRPTHSYAC